MEEFLNNYARIPGHPISIYLPQDSAEVEVSLRKTLCKVVKLPPEIEIFNQIYDTIGI